MIFLRLIGVLFGFLPMAVYAAIGGIGNAQVDEGVLTVQARATLSSDEESDRLNNRMRQRIMTDYGVNDWFATGFFAQGERLQGDDIELEALMWESRIELTSAAEDGFYSGIRFRYTFKDGDDKPDDAHVRLVIGMPIGAWDVRFNQIIGSEVGRDSESGILWDSRVQVSYGYASQHRVGMEWLGNFGNLDDAGGFHDQQHEFGPVFVGPITDAVSYETGYRYGASERAADHSWRLFIIRRF